MLYNTYVSLGGAPCCYCWFRSHALVRLEIEKTLRDPEERTELGETKAYAEATDSGPGALNSPFQAICIAGSMPLSDDQSDLWVTPEVRPGQQPERHCPSRQGNEMSGINLQLQLPLLTPRPSSRWLSPL